MAIGNIIGKIVRILPKTEGAAGRITLGRTQLKMLGKQDKKVGELVQKALKGTKEPKLDLAYKAESNYAIAGMRLRDGKTVLGQGAVSITNPGSSQAVVKYRASANGGSTLQANGFLDGGKVADGKDMAVSLSRKGGKVKNDLEIGQAARHHIEFDEQQAVDLAKKLDAKDILQRYTEATNRLQRTLDSSMVNIRRVLRGNIAKSTSKAPLKFSKVSKEGVETLKTLKKFQKPKMDFSDKIAKKEYKPLEASKLSLEGVETLKKFKKPKMDFSDKIAKKE